MGKVADKARKARANLRKMGRTQFVCNCGCKREWKDYRLWNAHLLKNYGGYWGGKGGKAMGRKLGKGADNVRKMGRAGLDAFGHVDRMGKRTDKWRSRPETKDGRVHLTRRALKARQNHSDDHGRADKLKAKAERARTRGSKYRADHLKAKEESLRARHPVRPAPVRPARPAPSSNGRASANGQLPGRTARTKPAKTGRAGR